MTKAPIATRYTYDFVRRSLPSNAARILEVGCGEGELAARLLQDGLEVVALDADEGCVAAARTIGVDARQANWPTKMDGTFDAVLFTRSLHHIAPLDEAVRAAVDALRPGGPIIVEDFRIEAASPRTDAWFTGLMRMFDAGGLLPDGQLDAILEKLDFGEHRDELHSSAAMKHALERHGAVDEKDAAYYFRYAETQIGEAMTGLVLQYEQSMIETGAIDALGKRFVLTRFA